MYIGITRLKRRKKSFFPGHSCLLSMSIVFLFLTVLYSSPSAIAGLSADTNVYFYNVLPRQFSVVWEADTPSSCTVEVYTDVEGNVRLYPSIISNTNSSELAQDRGVMQVDVKDLPSSATTYYVRTVSTEKGTGITHYFPDPGNLLSVTTERDELSPPQHINGDLIVSFYDQKSGEIDPNDHTKNVISDMVVIVDAGGHYPLSSSESGWISEATNFIVSIDFSSFLFQFTGGYWDWDKIDHPITIMAFGGKALSHSGKGGRVINTTFPAALIDNEDMNLGDCLINYEVVNPPEACDTVFNVINMYYIFVNQPPTINLNHEYTASPDTQITINVCALDPEGDPITNISLGGDVPSGMSIQFPDRGDPNCAIITWIPQSGGFYKNIQVTVADASGSATKAFTVTVFHGPPATPTASIIQPASLKAYTNVDVICKVDKNSVLNPDPEDITYIDYQWYDTNSTVATGDDILVLNDSDTTNKYQSVLPYTLTLNGKQYYCKVMAHDVDGFSAPSAAPGYASFVNIVNTPPVAPYGCNPHLFKIGPRYAQFYEPYRFLFFADYPLWQCSPGPSCGASPDLIFTDANSRMPGQTLYSYPAPASLFLTDSNVIRKYWLSQGVNPLYGLFDPNVYLDPNGRALLTYTDPNWANPIVRPRPVGFTIGANPTYGLPDLKNAAIIADFGPSFIINPNLPIFRHPSWRWSKTNGIQHPGYVSGTEGAFQWNAAVGGIGSIQFFRVQPLPINPYDGMPTYIPTYGSEKSGLVAAVMGEPYYDLNSIHPLEAALYNAGFKLWAGIAYLDYTPTVFEDIILSLEVTDGRSSDHETFLISVVNYPVENFPPSIEDVYDQIYIVDAQAAYSLSMIDPDVTFYSLSQTAQGTGQPAGTTHVPAYPWVAPTNYRTDMEGIVWSMTLDVPSYQYGPWMEHLIDPKTGIISFTPQFEGAYDAIVRATDPYGATRVAPFTIFCIKQGTFIVLDCWIESKNRNLIIMNGLAESLMSGSTITRIDCDWGDGKIFTGINFPVSHTYDMPGSYMVTVTAYDSDGNSLSRILEIDIFDMDGDSVRDTIDNCIGIFNPDQGNADNDGFGDACDCWPADPNRYPGSAELCNGVDDNCNGIVDEGCASSLSPWVIDFGDVPIGENSCRSFTIAAYDTNPFTIQSSSFDSPDIFLSSFDLNFTQGESRLVTLTFSPSGTGMLHETIPIGHYTLELIGRGSEYPSNIRIGSVTLKEGMDNTPHIFKVPVYLNTKQDLCNLSFHLFYNPGSFRFDHIELVFDRVFVEKPEVSVDEIFGKMDAGIMNLSGGVAIGAGTGKICDIVFILLHPWIGSHPFSITVTDATDTSSNPLWLGTIQGEVNIIPPISGDIDGDCALTPADIILFYRYLSSFTHIIPTAWREQDTTEIPSDETIKEKIKFSQQYLDLDYRGGFSILDLIYMYRGMLEFNEIIPSNFRNLHHDLPSDEALRYSLDLLKPVCDNIIRFRNRAGDPSLLQEVSTGRLYLEYEEHEPGIDIMIPVYLDLDRDLMSLSFTLYYNQNNIEFQGIDLIEFPQDRIAVTPQFDEDIQKGVLRVGFLNFSGDTAIKMGDGMLLELPFKVKSDASPQDILLTIDNVVALDTQRLPVQINYSQTDENSGTIQSQYSPPDEMPWSLWNFYNYLYSPSYLFINPLLMQDTYHSHEIKPYYNRMMPTYEIMPAYFPTIFTQWPYPLAPYTQNPYSYPYIFWIPQIEYDQLRLKQLYIFNSLSNFIKI